MFICVTNGSKRNAENYDRLINLNDLPEAFPFIKIIEEDNRGWIISKNGITRNNLKFAKEKGELLSVYQRGVNQIVSNDSKTNFTWESPTGEIIEFVGIGSHLEKEI